MMMPILLAVVMVYLTAVFLLTARLRRRHTEVWRKLGEPGFLNSSIRNSSVFGWWFLFDGAYRSLDDAVVSNLVRAIRFLALVFVLLIITGAILSIAAEAS